ncbi:PLDc N-terminal domain-containing protein [Anditalea andensis]|uniref:Cardiolipin synthase N-terminal domain-containing protein n=1 Tax=Anditalea andensis TaxID=1048983 RepID=A0A074KXR1_9BACT|nr:PLDc N-terminal domain-containing protein [Anditalea andensis]KEO72398.1 hypothetical protein EL17_16775 [Anditalea andensis]
MKNFDLPPFLFMIWQIAAVIILIFFMVSLVMILSNRKLPTREKMLWIWGTFLLPILGPLLFMVFGREGK